MGALAVPELEALLVELGGEDAAASGAGEAAGSRFMPCRGGLPPAPIVTVVCSAARARTRRRLEAEAIRAAQTDQ